MWITTSRILLVPLVLIAIEFDTLAWRIVAAILFLIASISDYFDGYYARKFNAVSNMGKFMDPIADKILVSSILVALIPSGLIDIWMVIILLARDTLISGLRSVAAADQVIIAAKPAGKWKTALQMVAIPIMIVNYEGDFRVLTEVGRWVLWFSVILSVTSGLEYLWGYWKAVKGKRSRASSV